MLSLRKQGEPSHVCTEVIELRLTAWIISSSVTLSAFLMFDAVPFSQAPRVVQTQGNTQTA